MSEQQRKTPSEFGLMVKQLLVAHAVSQKELAGRVSVAPESLNRAIQGGRRPSAALVLDIAAALRLGGEQQQELLRAAGYSDSKQVPVEGEPQRSRGVRFGSGIRIGKRSQAELLREALRRTEETHQILEALLSEQDERQ